MPDSDVVRARRRRAHLRGDHRDCGPKCAARRAARAASVPMTDSIVATVDAFAAAVGGWADDDPRRVELALVREMAKRLDAGDGDWRMGESVVNLLHHLAVYAEDPPDFIDELRARGAARRAKELVGQVPNLRPRQHWINGEPGEHHGELA